MKKEHFVKSMVSLLLLVGILSTVSVSGSAFIKMNLPAGETEWILKTSNANVDFYYKIDNCNGEKAVFLKIVNKNDHKITVKWEELYIDRKSGVSIENFNGQKEIIILANTTVEAACNSREFVECLIPFSMVTPTTTIDVQSFDFMNISVTAAQ
ncbi:MAG: hypothetical protein MUC31_03610 [Bacteroidales bacterium]|jgi:hypothetical protein|nr:hypothetical protein [Bacteroidales bacterium]